MTSLLCQTFTEFEWIVIDGGSTDGSTETVAECRDRIAYMVSEPDRGIYHAMNKGIAASAGEYLLFLNSGDCLHDKDVLANVAPWLDGKDYYIGSMQTGSEILTVEISDFADLVSYAVRFIPHQCTFMHRRVFDRYGMYDESMRIAGDWEFFYRSIIFGDAEGESLPYVVAVYEPEGISVRESTAAKRETEAVRLRHKGVNTLAQFYKYNYEKIAALNDAPWMYFIFRVCYRIYRMMHGRR